MSVLKTVGKKTLEEIAQILKEEAKGAIEKALGNLTDTHLVNKTTENGQDYYEISSEYSPKISTMRSLVTEPPAESPFKPDKIDLRDIVMNAPPSFISAAIRPIHFAAQSELPPPEFVESSIEPGGAAGESDFYRVTDFESNLATIMESNLPWKKELIEILKLVNVEGNHEKAIEVYQRAIQIAQKKGTKEQVIDLYYKMAKEWEYLNNNPKERECYSKSLEVAKKSEKPENIIAVYLRLAIDSVQNKKYEQALKEYQEVIELAKKNKMKKYVYEAFNEMAFIYRELNQFENALDDYLQNIPLCKELYPETLPALYNKIGAVLIKL